VICVIQEAGNVGLEERCKAAASTFEGEMENLQTDNTDLAGSGSTIESKLQDSSIDGILALGGDMAGAAVSAVEASGSDAQVGTFDLNADVAQNIIDGKLLFAIDQQPYVQGYLGVTGIYLKLLNGNDIGGGQPVYSGPAIITKDNAEAVLQFARTELADLTEGGVDSGASPRADRLPQRRKHEHHRPGAHEAPETPPGGDERLAGSHRMAAVLRRPRLVPPSPPWRSLSSSLPRPRHSRCRPVPAPGSSPRQPSASWPWPSHC
jgi:hypothetical protein